MLVSNNQKHIFAIYHKNFDFFDRTNSIYEINDKYDEDLINRVVNVLRLNAGDKFIIFASLFHATVIIVEFSKKRLVLEIESMEKNIGIEPEVTWFLPILKKAAFEEALYNLAQLGIQNIQLLNSEKSQNWFSNNPKELSRAEKILISAAEQSKNYNIPKILSPISIESLSFMYGQSRHVKIFFDIDAKLTCRELALDLNSCGNKHSIVAIAGPEGDFTINEKEVLKQTGFKSYKLTPTILRAEEAITIGAGIIRSFL